jgi:PAS domain S-box-containing protein
MENRNFSFSLSGYTIAQKIYSTPKTIVYQAEQHGLRSGIEDRPVIIKRLSSVNPSDQDFLDLFHQYVITKDLGFSGIVRPYSLELSERGYVLVMEDFGGISLEQYRRLRELSLTEILRIAIQLAEILADLYQAKIVHQNIQLANVLINPTTGKVKLIGFSLASRFSMTTPESIAPRKIGRVLADISVDRTDRANQSIDYRNDFYALGSTIHELLTGQLPLIPGETSESIHDRSDSTPPFISQIVAKLMAENIEDCYQSALEIKNDLEKCSVALLHPCLSSAPAFNLTPDSLSDKIIDIATLPAIQSIPTLASSSDGIENDRREHQRQEDALRVIVEGTAGKTGADFYQTCTRYLAEIFGMRHAFLTKLVDESLTKSYMLSLWTGQEFLPPYEMELAGTPCLSTYQNSWGIFPEKLQAQFPLATALASLGGESYMSVVIRDFNGNILGNLGVIDTKPLPKDTSTLQFILQLFANRVAAEMLRQADEDLLKKQQQQMQAFIDNLPSAIYLKDLQGCYQLLNLTSASWFDCKTKLSIGKTDREIFPADIAQQIGDDDLQLIQSGRVQTKEETIKHEDGTLRTCISTKFILSDENGKPYGIGGVSTDITDRKRAEEQLHQINQTLENSNQEILRANHHKDAFLATMSHELRTPLNSILGLSEALKDEVFGSLNERQIKSVRTIERSGTHLLSLINDILDVSKIEAGKLELDITTTLVSQLCQSSLSFVKQQASNKQIELDLQLLATAGNIAVDKRRMSQVLINLLSNAVKFTPIGGRVTLSVIRQEREDTKDNIGWIDFAVIDTGIGITDADQKKLFRPFIQLDSNLNRQYAGTGLGLTLVKQITELHGGNITLQSTIDRGSCFKVRLPQTCLLANRETLKSIDFLETYPPSANLETPKPALILLAEDNEANISTFSSYLIAKGYHVILAEDGQEAINLVQSEHPDLILMDIQMPKMDGLEAISLIRQNPRFEKTPIIALTALAMKGDRERCLDVGANEYLAKPVSMKQLHLKMQELLTRSQTD